MFDVDDFVASCRAAVLESEPRLAIKDVVERAVADPGAVAAALPPEAAGIFPLHVADDLTVMQIVWAPGMVLGPHDHRMWAAIGVYSGGEDNRFFRRADRTLADSGERSLQPRDVLLLGDDVIHAVTNPTAEPAGTLHVYGGDFFATPRSEWWGDPPAEHPFDIERVRALFDEANAARGS
jgi:predicted metal-dependent enzyme (double-stranded beta helix superfamily)